jgi:hypothetical protein
VTIVAVDINFLMPDYHLIEANMQTLLSGCQRSRIPVHVIEIVIDEFYANY